MYGRKRLLASFLVEGGRQGKVGRIAFHLERDGLVHRLHGSFSNGRFNVIERQSGFVRQGNVVAFISGWALSA